MIPPHISAALARERDELRIVADQAGTPNWSRDLAQATARLVARGRADLAERSGLYHFTSTGSTKRIWPSSRMRSMPGPNRLGVSGCPGPKSYWRTTS